MRTRSLLAASLLAAGGVALLFFDRTGSVPLFAGAAAVLLLLPGRSVNAPIAQAMDSDALGEAVAAMRLSGPGIVRPHAGSAMLFIPAKELESETCPVFDGDALRQRPPVGVWVTPPGAGLHALYPGKESLEAATRTLQQALPAMGLGDKVKVERGPHVRVTWRPHIDSEAVTSYIGMVLAVGLQRPVQLVAKEEVEGGVRTEWA